MEFGVFLALLKSHWWVRFNRIYLTILKVKVWKILIFEWILFWKFKKIAKIRFGRKNQLSPHCLHITKFLKIQFLKCEKWKCVHTWGNNTSYANENDKNKYMFNLLEQIEKHETNLLAKYQKLIMLYYNWWTSKIDVHPHGWRLL